MPEAPELEVVKDFLVERAVGTTVVSAKVLKATVLRPLAGDFSIDIVDRMLEGVRRSGKFLVITLAGDRLLVVNPMLTGGFQWSVPSDRVFKRTCFTLSLSNGHELRYIDDKQMGRVYYVSPEQLDEIPQFTDLDPDVLNSEMTLVEFKERLRPFHGEIKGIITRGRVVSGIGNAYVDEILWDAQIYPFRKKKELKDDDLQRLLDSSKKVIIEAT
jgi:formamidopyrimidine-DNA glycosylase